MKRPVYGQRSVYCYARVSTEDQAREGVSLAAQIERMQAYAAAMRPGEDVTVLVDEGVSAKTLDRPAMTSLLADAKEGRVATLVVLKLDRLTRCVRDLADLLDVFERCSVALCSLSESLDTSTASGRLMLNLLASVSQWEREAIAERTAFALAHKRRNGCVYGPVPYGFTRDGSKLVPCESQQFVLKSIRDMRANGVSIRKIALWLNQQGIKTPRGADHWFPNTLQQVLHSKSGEITNV